MTPLRAWVNAHRLRRAVRRAARREPPPLEAIARRVAPGRSFVDVGCMWRIDGAIAFAAHDAGATTVTGVDETEATAAFGAENARRGDPVRFVRGDLHEQTTLDEVGVHDVVWSTGVLYHAPHPVLTLERLRSITGQTLVLGSATIPEIPGFPQACVYLPHLTDRQRAAFAGAWPGVPMGIATPFHPEEGYANWWWGITPSALDAMLRTTGFQPVETIRHPFYTAVVANAA